MTRDDILLSRISEQLDILIRLIVSVGLAEGTMKERIVTLSNTGIAPKEIAEIVGTTSNTVNVTLSQHRRKKRKGSQ